MRLTCPFCGERDGEEFVNRGGVPGPRPDAGVPDALEAFVDYVHVRANPAGPGVEYWYHAAGCRSWLRVSRDTRTHAVLSVQQVAP